MLANLPWRARLSVACNGCFSVYVNSVNDICFIATTGAAPEEWMELPGLVHSVAMAPDGKLFGFVFRDVNGNPEPRITVIDVSAPRRSSELPAGRGSA